MKKKLLLITLLIITLLGCERELGADKNVSKLESPVILIGKYRSPNNKVVAVKDAKGVVFTSNNSNFAYSMQCRNIGDNIK